MAKNMSEFACENKNKDKMSDTISLSVISKHFYLLNVKIIGK